MEFKKTVQDYDNPIFKRKEVKVIVVSSLNPTFANSTKFISDKFSKAEDDIAIKKIGGKFGRNTFLIEANIYQSKEAKDKIEPKVKAKKGAAQ